MEINEKNIYIAKKNSSKVGKVSKKYIFLYDDMKLVIRNHKWELQLYYE